MASKRQKDAPRTGKEVVEIRAETQDIDGNVRYMTREEEQQQQEERARAARMSESREPDPVCNSQHTRILGVEADKWPNLSKEDAMKAALEAASGVVRGNRIVAEGPQGGQKLPRIDQIQSGAALGIQGGQHVSPSTQLTPSTASSGRGAELLSVHRCY